MQDSNEVVVGKAKQVHSVVGTTLVTPVTIGGFSGNILSHYGVEFLDFSEFSPFAFYCWPLGEGDAQLIVSHLAVLSENPPPSTEIALQLKSSSAMDLEGANGMDHDEKLRMVRAMKVYGGGFVKALAECFLLADRYNLQKLCEAFAKYVDQYRDMALYDEKHGERERP